ncbi:DoxX family protein [Niabella beijingensis]|uniref:DoxX family protein n=1 Tax=Niabella beijingensis TaxID=2872700 RepID=UPI001CBC20D4|nr:DoxX family protein [Niabella beijingensis]MBZ4188322.1 DoxX family protein [Niabella beijingensis]
MKFISTKYRDNHVALGILLLRVVTGCTMAAHGLKKLTGFNAMAAKGFADPFHIGVKASLSLTIFAEFFCALFIVLGLLTRLATLPLIVCMCVALFIAHDGKIFGDGELAAVYLAVFLTLFIIGPGKYSVDKAIGK